MKVDGVSNVKRVFGTWRRKHADVLFLADIGIGTYSAL